MNPLLATCPFLDYAGSRWCYHAEKGGPQLWIEEYTWIWESQSAKFTQWLDMHDLTKGCILNRMGDELVQLSDFFDRNTFNLIQISAMLGYESLLWYGLQKRPQDTSITFILAAYYNREEVIDKMLSDPTFRGKIPHLEALLHISCSNHTRTIWLILDSFEDSVGPNHAHTGLRVILSVSFVSGNVNIAEEAISSPNENHKSIVRLLLDSLDPVSPLFTSIGGNYYPLGLTTEIGH